ncbi:MAG: hypothetical protein Q4G59_01905 [Planctomycetia bacterium]|nr:hypothetical protein [Planctomycetia bacterium]
MDTPFRPGVNQKMRKTHGMQVIAKLGKTEALRLIVLCITVFLFEIFSTVLFAQAVRSPAGARRNDGSEDLSRASTSRTSAEQIVGKIPWQYFSAENQARIKGIISNHTLYRRLPISGGYCNPEILDFVLYHPETIVGLWETLGYTELTLQRVGNSSFLLQDKAGTVGNIDVLFQSDEMLVIWCNGSYRGPVKSGEIVGEMLIVLQVRYTEDVLRKPVAICRLDSFVRVKNVGIDLMGRIFGPALGKIADNNLEQTFVFVSSISKTAEEAPDALRDLVLRTSSLSPQTRENFLLIAQRAYAQSQLLTGGEAIRYQLLPKLGQEHGNYARIIKRNTQEASPTVRAWRPEDVPAHWRTGRVVTPAHDQAETLPESEALSNKSVRTTFGPTVPEMQYATATEEQHFSASAQSSNDSLPEHSAPQSQQKFRAYSSVDSSVAKPLTSPARTQAAGPAARVPSPTLLSPEESDVAAPAKTGNAVQSQTVSQPRQAVQKNTLPLLTLPGTSKATVKTTVEKQSGPKTEVVPENTWRSVPLGK